ncbi:MAG: HK97 gp10 family phage protein [Sheuella sp.]|nr:HK97 gp10 family phage protein [Sheuella sp.]
MASSSVTISGLKELDELLKNLPAKIEGNVMRGALRAGQKVMLDGAKQNLASITKQDTGLLEKSLRISFSRKSQKYGWLRSHLIAGSEEAYYAHMVEFGTVAHYISIKKSARPGRMTRKGEKKYGISTINKMVKRGSLVIGGNFVGQSVVHPGSKPKPFMRRTFDSYNIPAINASVDYIRKRLPKELKKAGL